ncbi:MAG: hypothetical protein ABS76_20575 [Pelagibacterium sp. SCN 64-44]|nr:MAG: hypothetical protein ABS76_20575 [Pelagibacterium sp. SCN 64-44]
MTIKSTLSVAALLAGVVFSGSAFAQTMVGNNDVSDADLPYVQQHCDALKLADENSDVAGTKPDEETTNEDGRTGLEADTAARNSSTTVDLDTITLDDCIAAGLVDG